MQPKIYLEYRLKFYLNARHYIALNGNAGDSHPHTWEFTLNIRIGRGTFTPFSAFERRISAFLAPYQNQLLNNVAPFTSILPTTENIAEYFAEQFYNIVDEINGSLVRVEASEAPNRTYVLNLAGHTEDPKEEQVMLSELVDSVLGDILQ